MKILKELLFTIILIVICVVFSTLFNKNEIKYTFFYNDNNNINLYDDLGNKLLDEDLNYYSDTNDNYTLIVNKNSQSAIIDNLGNFIINYGEYDSIEEYGKLYLAYKDSDTFLITANNKLIRKIDDKKELVSNTIRNYSVVLFDNVYHIYNSNVLLLEIEKGKNKRIGMIETKDYGVINYNNNAYIFSHNNQFVKKYEKNIFDNAVENKGVLLAIGTKNVVINNYNEVIDNNQCESIKIDEKGNIYCNEEELYKNEYEDKYNIKCDTKCNLYINDKKRLSNYDEITLKETNMNKYIIAKKNGVTDIFNEKIEKVYTIKNNAEIFNNYIKINNKIYSFEGNEIKL